MRPPVSLPAIEYPADLPVSGARDRIVGAMREHQVVIIAGETGSGKTTQLPKMCLEAGFAERGGRIGCTQPRRVAAMSISKRVAEELKVTWGREVGCRMRFSDDTGPDTVLKFMTDGILLAEIQSDPLLRRYSALIIDEAHERSLNIDFLLGYLQGLLQRRRDLKLIITSATIDTEVFSQAFGGAPVIEVSGRTFPVEVRYWPIEQSEDEDGEVTYIEAAARATEDVLLESAGGDVLVFMPAERDIRDCADRLQGSLGQGFEVLPLYGRMAGGDQQRIFSPGPKRRVIVATNIAETSLTIPRIRYVIDTGLARISRYAPRTRTKRLPVEPVAQSSANQRKGRAGRIQDGICVRLYSEEDFEKRPRFTQPEIQRANLAEVILRMKAFGLGEIETFPFLNPPPTAAVRAGYALLHELGALDDEHTMTPLGKELARLPLDPSLGRMLLHARQENVLPELLVIAAGLSLQDPRERPQENREAASKAHQAFAHRTSDFLSLIRIWIAAEEAGAWRGGNVMRRFCKTNFLSVTRMREWRDIHGQLADAMDTKPDTALNIADGPAADAVHRSVLSALLGHVARREERNVYKTAGNRQVMLFPGSHLNERRERKAAKGATPEKSRQPVWIMAAEIVETSELFARTAAGIQPEWIVEVGAHLCEFRYTEPEYDEKTGRVTALERVLLQGLEVRRGRADYGKVNAKAATEIFVRGALIDGETPIPHTFFSANRRLRDKLETAFARTRSQRVFQVAERLFDFYTARLEGVSSIHDLNRIVRARVAEEPTFLHAEESDLSGGLEEVCDPALFPDEVKMGNSVLPLHYSYSPGGEKDGVTVKVPLPVAQHLTSGQVQWMVPGMREEIASALLRALPKSARRALMPLEHKIKEIARGFDPGQGDFLAAMALFITRHYGVTVSARDWAPDSLPPYLRPRVEVVGHEKATVAAGRDMEEIRREVRAHEVETGERAAALKKWENPDVKTWSFGDLPDHIVVEHLGGVEVRAWPGLKVERGGVVAVRLFNDPREADRATPPAVRILAERALVKDIDWLRKELRSLTANAAPPAKKQAAGFMDALNQAGARLSGNKEAAPGDEALQASALEHVLAHALRLEPTRPLTAARFEAMVAAARKDMPGLARRVREYCATLYGLRRQLLAAPKRYPGLEADLRRLLAPDFLKTTPHERLTHLPRYLKAMLVRCERAALQPAKDADRAALVAPWAEAQEEVPDANREAYRWLLEEYRVSLFAQELGTAQPASPKRLEALLEAPASA